MNSVSVSSLPLLRYAGDQTYFDEIKQFYYRDEFSHQVQEWNRQRTLAIERALTQFLYPQMAKELKSKLIAEAKESIVRVNDLLFMYHAAKDVHLTRNFPTKLFFCLYSPAVAGCITGLKSLLTGQITWLKKMMI